MKFFFTEIKQSENLWAVLYDALVVLEVVHPEGILFELIVKHRRSSGEISALASIISISVLRSRVLRPTRVHVPLENGG